MYADLPLGVNLVEDPSFERGVGYWSTQHTFLPGVSTIGLINPPGPPTSTLVPLSGKYVMLVTMSPGPTEGAGGTWYDLGVLPQGTYTLSISAWSTGGNGRPIAVRAGRSNDVTKPTKLGDFGVTGNDSWQTITGDFTSDGVNPSMILLINEAGSVYHFAYIDQVAVISTESPFQTDIYAQMIPVADQDAAKGYALKRYLRAASVMFDRIEAYSRDAPDGTPGWARICNPANAPAETLDWLSQISGTVIPNGSLTPEKRRLIKEAPGRSRGSRIAIVREVQTLLSDTKFVAFRERTTDDDHFQVAVLKSEAPASDWFTNLVTNPSLETNTTGWSTSGGILVAGGSLSRQSGGTPYGSWSGRVDTTVLNQGAFYSLGVLPAGKYGYFFALKGVTGAERMYIQVGDTVINSQLLANSWKEWKGVMTADGVSSWGIMFMTMTPTPAAATFYFDAVMVGAGNSAPRNFFTTPTLGSDSLVLAAVNQARPVEFRSDLPVYLDDDWSFASMNASYITWKDIVTGNDQLAPIYRTYQDIKRHFSTYDDLKNNTPHSWENVLADSLDPMLEKTVTGWSTTVPASMLNAGASVALQTTNFKRGVSGGRLTTSAGSVNTGMAIDLTSWTNVRAGVWSVTIWVRSVGATANIEISVGTPGSMVTMRSGATLLPADTWVQVNGEFTAVSGNSYYLVLRNINASVKTVDFDLVAMTQNSMTWPATF